METFYMECHEQLFAGIAVPDRVCDIAGLPLTRTRKNAAATWLLVADCSHEIRTGHVTSPL
jgi:hypothetical protein